MPTSARHARHLAGERVKLVHHRIDGVLQFQNFALHIDRNFARQIAIGHSGGHLRDVADLVSEIAGHGIDRIGKILPRTGNAFHLGLPAQLSFGTDFARHARDFRCERVQLVNHRIDGALQFQNLAANVYRDLAR